MLGSTATIEVPDCVSNLPPRRLVSPLGARSIVAPVPQYLEARLDRLANPCKGFASTGGRLGLKALTPLPWVHKRAAATQEINERIRLGLTSLKAIESAVEASRSAGEFPLTDMSRAVANVLWKTRFPHGAALDVGTGTGFHGILMALKGSTPVLAIDRCPTAIQHAARRAASMGVRVAQTPADAIRTAQAGDTRLMPVVAFLTCDLSDLPSLDVQFSVIAFNPPAYYYSGHGRGPDLAVPAASGVYAGPESEAGETQRSHIYRFFQHVVLPFLAPGGHVICAWPGLERRVVERDPLSVELSDPIHPAVLLREWFHVRVNGLDLAPDRFFCKTATIRTDYGLGDSFRSNLDLTRPVYSRLFSASDPSRDGLPTFRFGVLHLLRSRADTFDVVDDEMGGA